ncbi:MAG TPA: hypothetical protein VGI90_09810 [Steroidobacteraceae bacterium]|jgi:hypothetical protein
MSRATALAALLLALSGCMACRQHPIACTVGIVAGAAVIGYEAAHHDRRSSPVASCPTTPSLCAVGSSP